MELLGNAKKATSCGCLAVVAFVVFFLQVVALAALASYWFPDT